MCVPRASESSHWFKRVVTDDSFDLGTKTDNKSILPQLPEHVTTPTFSPKSATRHIPGISEDDTSNEKAGVLLFDKNGFKAYIKKLESLHSVTDYIMSFYNALPVRMENLVFQAAVPKVC